MLTQMNFKLPPIMQQILLSVILATAMFRVVLWSLLRNVESNFLEPDSISYYLPSALNFKSLFLTFTNDSSFLGAQVTPIFPLYLSLFLFLGISGIILLNLLLSFITIYVIYKIGNHLLGNSFGIFCAFLFSIEGSIWFSSLTITPETLFTLFIALFIYFLLLQPFTKLRTNFVLAGFTLGTAVLTRPIALLMLVSFVFAIVFLRSFRTTNFFILISTASTITIMWAARNFYLYGVPNISTISAHNLLYYEGAAAQAEALDISLEDSQKLEQTLQSNALGNSASVSDTYSYKMERGLSLIRMNFLPLLQSHLSGALRTLFGPGRASIDKILLEGFNLEGGPIVILATIIFQLFVILLVFGSILGSFYFWNKDRQFLVVFACTAGSLLVAASGAIGYSRFRVPMIPVLALLCVPGLYIFRSWLFRNIYRLRNFFSKKFAT